MDAVDRRSVLATGATGVLGISTVLLPTAALAASPAPAGTPAPDAPVTGATIAGGVVSLTLAVAPTGGSHTYALWRDTADLTGDPEPDATGTATDGAVTLTIGGGSGTDAPLDETQAHVLRITHTNAGGSAVSTLTFTPQALGPTTGGAASGVTGGTGAESDEAVVTHAVAGFGPTAVTFSLAGAGGGSGGDDGAGDGGAGGAGGTLVGSIAVQNGDVLRVSAGGAGGAGTTGSSAGARGLGGGSTTGFYGGGDGGRPGGDGGSGGGGGGGAATVLRRVRVGGVLDVVAAGGGGGGGSGNALRNDLGARAFASEDPSPSTRGEDGQPVDQAVDGGGGGGGGGGVRGGGRGDTFSASVGDSRTELFGEGGCRGESSVTADDVTVTAAGTAASSAPGTGTLTWHGVTVAHSVTPATVAPAGPVIAAGVAAGAAGTTSTLTIALRAAAGDGTHTFEVWNGRSDLTGDPEPTPDDDGTVSTGATTLALAGLDLTQSHVVRVTHDAGAAGSATTTVTLAPESASATGGAGSTPSGSTGGTGGAGASATTVTIAHAAAGFGTTAVAFTLQGGSGGTGGDDGLKAGGVAGSGERITGTLAVRDGDTLQVHAGGGGGDGADGSSSVTGGGGAGGSGIAGAYAGGVGGQPGPSGTSGGGAGGGGASVLRRTRGAVTRDVVAAGGGGGGGSGNADPSANALDARAYDTTDPVVGEGTGGEAGEGRSSGDGGGGGGGGGGVIGGGRGDLFLISTESFGQGGRRGSTSVADADLTVGAPTTPGAARAAGTATITWHTLSVVHSS